MANRVRVPIDHSRLIDGFAELRGRTHYEDESLQCGDCGRAFVFTAAAQKYVFEVRGVPVKMRNRGAAFCDACRDVRARRNRAARQLKKLEHAAQEARAASEREPRNADVLLAWVAARVAHLEGQARPPTKRAIDDLRASLRRAGRLNPNVRNVEEWAGRVEKLAER
jgi:hypothetical protein